MIHLKYKSPPWKKKLPSSPIASQCASDGRSEIGNLLDRFEHIVGAFFNEDMVKPKLK